MRKLFVLALLASLVFPPAPAFAAEPRDARLPGGVFTTVLPPAASSKTAEVRPFRLDRALVSNADYARFVRGHSEWQRDHVARLFADESYLGHWRGGAEPGEAIARQPVTQVSWFAAEAYCESEHARLPTWHEWEFAAAADETRKDARDDPAWRERILGWYANPSGVALPAVGRAPKNAYGVYDVHGVVWEWVEDFAGMMISADNRNQGDPDLLKFCGAGALSTQDRENYAVLMRVAMLSSLTAQQSTRNLGFRCARDVPKPSP